MDNNVLEIFIFNVGSAQCIFFYPRNHPDYGMFVDCALGEDYNPIEFLIKKNLIHHDGSRHVLGNLTITNYDHDHFFGLPHLIQKMHIQTVSLAKNISSDELKNIKTEITEALKHLCFLKDTYIHPVPDNIPPYNKHLYSLTQYELGSETINTNHLSQLVFVEYGGSKICIAGDLERFAWEKILLNQEIQKHLSETNVVVAAHHGRDNGYHENVFLHCINPECIVISDKDIMHDTQDSMANIYAKHVKTGIYFNGKIPPRKVLTTRSDGHLLIRFLMDGSRTYHNFLID